jgi:flagellin
VARENFSAAESQIRDVDVAAEAAELTRLNILQQAGAAILAQANQQPTLALQLLR